MPDERFTNSESGPTYKALFLGAVAIIGSFIGWWVTDLKQSVARIWERIEKIDTRTTILETGALEHKYQHQQIQQDNERYKSTVDANTKTIRELERYVPRK